MSVTLSMSRRQRARWRPRPPSAPGPVRVERHVAVVQRSRPDGEHLLTRGLAAVGLPELELARVPLQLAGDAHRLLHQVAQRLYDLLDRHDGGPLSLDLVVLPALKPDDAPLPVGLSATSDGDERRLRVHAAGRSPEAAPDALLRAARRDVLGAAHHLASTVVDPWLEAAMSTARAELAEVRRRFVEGLPPHATLLLRVGYRCRRELRSTWVRVSRWERARLRGRVASTPSRDRRWGPVVSCDADDIVDWCILHADGRREGCRTEMGRGGPLEGA